MKTLCYRLAALSMILVMLIGAGAYAAPIQGLAARQEVGKVFAFQAQSPHPAPDGWSHTFAFSGATFLRLHIKDFKLAPGDRMVISSPDGAQVYEYSEMGPNGKGDFWSFAIIGDALKIEFYSPSGKSNRLKIVDVGYGTVNLENSSFVPEVVCGDDGREAIACHMDETVIEDSQRSVARLLFTVKRSQYLCTGELVRGSNENTLITNAHCLDSQSEVDTLEARFNYQYTTCGGSTMAVATSFYGDTWLKSNAERYNRRKPGTGLDYTLLTLFGDAEAQFDELIPTTATIGIGDFMNFIQHPAGRPKEIGYWEDFAGTVRCSIATRNMTYGSSAPNTQIGYGCDSEGGSSGSAITRAADGKMIGLHHYGGVDTCLNSGTMMSYICQDAGSLLICDGN